MAGGTLEGVPGVRAVGRGGCRRSLPGDTRRRSETGPSRLTGNWPRCRPCLSLGACFQGMAVVVVVVVVEEEGVFLSLAREWEDYSGLGQDKVHSREEET